MDSNAHKRLPASILGLLLLAATPVPAQEIVCQDPSQSLLWQISGKQSQVHLFGSVHLGHESFYPLHETIDRAFRAADQLVFEVDPRSAENPRVASEIQQRAQLGPDETLSDYLSQPVIEQLRETLTSLGVPPEPMMKFRPWFLTMTVATIPFMSLGYNSEQGVESHLLKEKSERIEVLELESLEEQIALLEALDGELYLSHTLDTLADAMEEAQLLIDSWRCGDKAALSALFRRGFDAEGPLGEQMKALEKKLLLDRNVVLAAKISEYLETGQGNYFIAVGAAHYLGKGSIIELLRDRDYKVDEVSLTH